MSKAIDFEEILPIIEEVLAKDGKVKFTPTGTSMLPMLRGGKDTVELSRVEGKLKKYDLPLYKRPNGKCVMHRIIKVKKDGYVMLGDHQWISEYPVPFDSVIGVMTSFTRNGKTYKNDCKGYKLYCKMWTAIRPFRMIYFRTKSLVKKIFNR